MRIPSIPRAYAFFWLIAFLVAKMVLQYSVVDPGYELHRDEFLYLDQAHHMAAGFISVPPLMSWIAKLISLLGGSVFWVRFFPALAGALVLLIAWLLAGELGGSLLSRILVSCALLFSVLVRLNILFQPNSFDILVWTAAFYFLVKFIRSKRPLWFYLLTADLVLGFYNKYTIVFLACGLLAGVLLTQTRGLVLKKYLWPAIAGGMILILPNLFWQISHHFPVFHHMEALKRTQLDNVSATGFLIDQVMYFSGSLVLIFAALAGFLYHGPYRPYRFAAIAFVTVLVLFLFLHAKSYYAAGLYPAMIVFGGVYLERILSRAWKIPVAGFIILVNLGIFC